MRDVYKYSPTPLRWTLRNVRSDIGDQCSVKRYQTNPHCWRQSGRAGTEHVAQETERLYDKKQEHGVEVQRERGPGHEL